MEVTITNKTKRPLLKRTEIKARIFFTGATPRRTSVAQAIADKEGYKKELLVVKHIYTQFGDTTAEVQLHLYDDAKTLERLERKNLVAKHTEKKQEKEAEE